MKKGYWADRNALLDPETDYAEIYRNLTLHEFPWDLNQALSFALFRTYAVPSIGNLLYRTGECSPRSATRTPGRRSAGSPGAHSGRGPALLKVLPPRRKPRFIKDLPRIKSYPLGYRIDELGTFAPGCPVPHDRTGAGAG